MKNPDDDLNRLLADIAQSTMIEPSAALQRRIAEIPLRHPRTAGFRWGWARLWTWSLAGALAMSLGALNGWMVSDDVAEASYGQDEGDALSQLALAEDYEGAWE